ncbi:hypothetical protein Ciccas_013331 [Cichlidogyrus casuarinus]|uniref:Serpin domain-containing protein n=1 Tax=Cichlidogyrus casuarinus TaxID=1844966 RepID=A0ABD2PN70_9PLAT
MEFKPFKYVSDFYKNCVEFEKKDEGKNWAVSPVTMLMSMIMALDGSSGQTRDQIKSALSIVAKKLCSTQASDKDPEEDSKIQKLLAKFKLDHLPVKMANLLYLNKVYNLKDCFIEEQKNLNGAIAKSLDFSDPKRAAKEINFDVSKSTDEQLVEMISPEDLIKDSVMILVNGLFHHVKFLEAFNPQESIKAYFHGCSKDITYMCRTGTMDYYKFQVLHAPLKAQGVRLELDNDLTLVIVIPDAEDGLKEMNKLLQERQGEWLLTTMLKKSHYRKKCLTLCIPKLDLNEHFEMTDILEPMGVEKAFRNDADFSNISESKIKLISVFHKAVLKVDESGTKAAAAPSTEEVKLELRADHPFFMAVVTGNGIPIIMANVWKAASFNNDFEKIENPYGDYNGSSK